jgi:hypothetical protein
MIHIRKAFGSKVFGAALAWPLMFVSVPLLVIAGTGTAIAQMGGDHSDGGMRGDRMRGDDRGGNGVGLGVGIGIGIGRAIIENAAEEDAKKKAGAGGATQTRTQTSEKRKRAARKGDGDDTSGPGKPPKTVTKDGDKKKDKDKKKTPEDPKDVPKQGEDPKDLAIDDCIVILQYGNDAEGHPLIPTREQDNTSAQNEDIKGSAELVAKGSPNAQTGTCTDAKGQQLEDVIKGFKIKGCCKRIQIFGHGTETGQLQLPYKIGDKVGALDRFGGKAKETMGGDDSDALKSALCKDPKGKRPIDAQVKINACYSANVNADGQAPIAKELAKSGIRTSGWSGIVDFNNGEKAVTPEGHDPQSKDTTFLPDPPKK